MGYHGIAAAMRLGGSAFHRAFARRGAAAAGRTGLPPRLLPAVFARRQSAPKGRCRVLCGFESRSYALKRHTPWIGTHPHAGRSSLYFAPSRAAPGRTGRGDPVTARRCPFAAAPSVPRPPDGTPRAAACPGTDTARHRPGRRSRGTPRVRPSLRRAQVFGRRGAEEPHGNPTPQALRAPIRKSSNVLKCPSCGGKPKGVTHHDEDHHQ